jgi:hypothetical protein
MPENPMAFDPITSAQKLEYTNNVALALQQTTSRLEMCATYQPNLKGKAAKVIELFGARNGSRNKPRGSTMQPTSGTIESVWCKPERLMTDEFILEKEDEIKNATTYASSYVQSDAATLNRLKDELMAAALVAPRILGEDGTESAVYSNPNGSVAVNYVPSGTATNSGLTVPKIVKGLELLELAEVDVEKEELFLQCTSIQITNLYNELMFINKDYRDKSVIDEARKSVRELLGVKIIRMPNAYVPKVSTTRSCMLWAKSGFHYGDFASVESHLERSILHYNRPVGFSEMWCGATRSEDAKFVKVDCLE